MKKSGIFLILFLPVLLALSLFALYAFWDTETASAAENRALAKEPVLSEASWFDGSFATALESFLSDHVFRRARLIQAAQTLEGLAERRMEVKLVTNAGEVGAGALGPQTDAAQDTDDGAPGDGAAAQTDADAHSEGGGAAVVLEDRILTVYADNPGRRAEYARAVNEIAALFPDYITKACMLAPMRIAFEEPQVTRYDGDERAAIEDTYKMLDSLILPLDAYSVLEDYEGPLDDLYLRTDHHWTHLAAFRAANVFLEELGREPLSLENYTLSTGADFLGYLYATNQEESLRSHRDKLVYYRPETVCPLVLWELNEDGSLTPTNDLVLDPARQGYYTFLGGSFAYAVVDGKGTDGSCVFVISDSYGNAFTTWLCEVYDTVVQIDPRAYGGGRAGITELTGQYGITDLLLLDTVDVLQSPYYVSRMRELAE